MELSLALSFIFILSTVQSGQSLQCYSCSTKGDPTCMQGDKLDTFKAECNSKAVDDTKKSLNTVLQLGSEITSKLGLNFGKAANIEADMVCQKIDVEEKDQKYTMRSCFVARKDPDNNMCDVIRKQLHSETVKITHCSQCTENLCNTSNTINPALHIISMSLAIIMINKKY